MVMKCLMPGYVFCKAFWRQHTGSILVPSCAFAIYKWILCIDCDLRCSENGHNLDTIRKLIMQRITATYCQVNGVR